MSEDATLPEMGEEQKVEEVEIAMSLPGNRFYHYPEMVGIVANALDGHTAREVKAALRRPRTSVGVLGITVRCIIVEDPEPVQDKEE